MIKKLLAPSILKSIDEEKNIIDFTDIQKLVIPKILSGENIIGISETGSGKTLSFVLPILTQIILTSKRPTRVLIITPTKELSDQILKVFKRFARHTSLISMSLYGGVSFQEQSKVLEKGVHIVVACPGRLKDHIEKETINLSGIETVVLDEADQLMDMGFLPDINIALEKTKGRKQLHLFSATFSQEVKDLVSTFLPIHHLIESNNLRPKESIAELFCPISPELKYPFLRFILKFKKIKSALIFTRTKDEAKNLGEQLLADRYQASVLIGDMTTHQRKKSLEAIKSKNAMLLIATDIASRGIDIPHVTHVINYNPPESYESYIHRIGRTARHLNQGEAITLFTPDELFQLEKLMGDKIFKKTKFKDFNYQLKIEKRFLKIF